MLLSASLPIPHRGVGTNSPACHCRDKDTDHESSGRAPCQVAGVEGLVPSGFVGNIPQGDCKTRVVCLFGPRLLA